MTKAQQQDRPHYVGAWLDAEQYGQLRRIARVYRSRMSSVIRLGIDELFAKLPAAVAMDPPETGRTRGAR